jgi:anti-sigma-K factor RskA
VEPNAPDGRTRWTDGRLDDMHHIVLALSELPAGMAAMKVQLENVQDEAKECHEGQKGLWARLDKREEQRESERRSDRRALWAAASVIVVAIIGAAVTVIAAAPHP